jgi:hypothetical protein
MASVSVVIQFFEDFDCIERVVERHACMDGLPPDAVWPLAQQAWQRNGSPCGTSV